MVMEVSQPKRLQEVAGTSSSLPFSVTMTVNPTYHEDGVLQHGTAIKFLNETTKFYEVQISSSLRY
jgi:hypothetical protein